MDSARHQGRHQSRHEADGYRRIELITGSVRRRRWTAEEKALILAESFAVGENVSDVARRHGVNRGLLQTWRRQALESATAATMPSFLPLRVEDPPVPPVEKPLRLEAPLGAGASPAGSIEIELGRARVLVQGSVDAEALRQVLTYLGRLR